MPDAHESCRNAPSQPHKCSRFIVYTKAYEKAQGAICFFDGELTAMVRGNDCALLASLPSRPLFHHLSVARSLNRKHRMPILALTEIPNLTKDRAESLRRRRLHTPAHHPLRHAADLPLAARPAPPRTRPKTTATFHRQPPKALSVGTDAFVRPLCNSVPPVVKDFRSRR